MIEPPSEKQLAYVRGIQSTLNLPARMLDDLCVQRFGKPLAGIDKQECRQLLDEMIPWRDIPAELRRACGQLDLF